MIDPDCLDYHVVERAPSLRARLDALRTNPVNTIGFTVASVIAAAAIGLTIAFVALLAAGRGVNGDVLAMCLFFLGATVMFVIEFRNVTGRGAGLAGFARANGLTTLPPATAPDYAGAAFASGRVAIDVAVRTSDADFVEVGNVIRLDAAPRVRRMYLRARLGSETVRKQPVITPEAAAALAVVGDADTIVVDGDELVVIGHAELAFSEADQLRAAFVAIAGLAEATGGGPVVGATGPEEVRSPMRPWRAAATVLATIAVLTIVMAVILSIADDVPFLVFLLVLGLLVTGTMALMRRMVDRTLGSRTRAGAWAARRFRPGPKPPRRP